MKRPPCVGGEWNNASSVAPIVGEHYGLIVSNSDGLTGGSVVVNSLKGRVVAC